MVSVSFATTAGLLAIQLLPAFELTNLSFAKLRAAWYQGGGLPVSAWRALFWPNALGALHPDQVTEQFNFTFLYQYNGMAPLALAIVAIFWPGRRTRLAGLLTLILFLLCFGNHVPGFTAAFERFPQSLRGAWYAEFFTCASAVSFSPSGGGTLMLAQWLTGSSVTFARNGRSCSVPP